MTGVHRIVLFCGLAVGSMLSAESGESLVPEIGWEVRNIDTVPTVALPGGAEAQLAPDTVVVDGQRLHRVLFGGGAHGGAAHKLALDRIQYTVAFHPSPPSTIFYVETDDRGFLTPEGIGIGSPYADVRATARSDRPVEVQGRCVLCLPSKWAAVFDAAKSCRNRSIKSRSVDRLLKSEDACRE